MKYKELISKSEAELKRNLGELELERANLAMKLRMSQEKQTHKLRVLKKDIARIKTLLQVKAST